MSYCSDLEHRILEFVVERSSNMELKMMTLNLHLELLRYAEILKSLTGVTDSENGLMNPLPDLILSRERQEEKHEIVQRITWQYTQVIVAITWICDNNLFAQIPALSAEKTVDFLGAFYQENVPAKLGGEAYVKGMRKFLWATPAQSAKILIDQRAALSKQLDAFRVLHQHTLVRDATTYFSEA